MEKEEECNDDEHEEDAEAEEAQEKELEDEHGHEDRECPHFAHPGIVMMMRRRRGRKKEEKEGNNDDDDRFLAHISHSSRNDELRNVHAGQFQPGITRSELKTTDRDEEE